MAAKANNVTPIRIPWGGVGESRTVYAPAALHSRIRAMEPRLQFGPNYSRAVADTLADASRQYQRGDFPGIARQNFETAERMSREGLTAPRATSAARGRSSGS